MGISPDPLGRGAYNLQSISATPERRVWRTRLARIPLGLLHGKTLFTLFMLRRPRDAEFRRQHNSHCSVVTIENYPQASIFNYFALIKVIVRT